jgi:glucose/arabinose dehydrogenase
MRLIIKRTLTILLGICAPALTHISYGGCTDPGANHRLPPIALEEITDGLKHPVHITYAGDGSSRLFVVEQAGVIRVIDQGQLLPQPFLDIHERVNSGGEKGLFSVAFHPQYKDNGLFYVDYTTHQKGLHSIIAEFKRRNYNQADPGSERVLLKIKQPYANHNGGQLAFGPDGYLYIGMGDGGSANDPFGNGQNTQTLLGKLLRIDVDRRNGTRAYGVPPDNPFIGTAKSRDEIWAFGLRNPWRFSFDTDSGLLYLADVGQDAYEEIDVIKKGRNYGWNIMEGPICTPGVGINCNKSGLELPIFSYPHPDGFSITGGFVYRGQAIPELCGVYIYGDYVAQRIWGLRYDGRKVTQQQLLLKTRHPISSFGEDQEHELYLADYSHGKVIKIVPAASSP